MSVKQSKLIKLDVKPPVNAYFNRNAQVIGNSRGRKLGNVIGASKAILAKEEFLKVVLPGIIAVASNSPEWNMRCEKYFNNIAKHIPSSGITFEIGFDYTDEPTRNKYLKLRADLETWYNKELERIARLAEVLRYQEEHNLNKDYTVKLFDLETSKIEYGKPINTEDYVLYCYCLMSSQVANRETEKNKSKNILFYFVEPELRKQKQAARFALDNKANKLFLDIITEEIKMDAILSIYSENIFKFGELEEKQMKLKHHKDDNPAKFIQIVEDKALLEKAFIYQCITNGLLKQLSNSSIIVDLDNNIIGNDIGEAIVILNDASKVAIKNHLTTRLKALKSKI